MENQDVKDMKDILAERWKNAGVPDDRPVPAWFKDVEEGDNISFTPTYRSGEYFDRFHKEEFTSEDGKKIKYYYYDPREYGFRADRKYPLITFFHGSGNSLVGDTCINYTGAEFYAKDSYQKTMGGAYLLIPVANEYVARNGWTEGGWGEEYDEIIFELIKDFEKNRTKGITEKAFFGTSKGAGYLFHLIEKYTYEIDIAIVVAHDAFPHKAAMHDFDVYGKYLFFAIGKRDELCSYEKRVVKKLPELKAMKHCFIYTPDWVRNGDKGIASIYAGVEMGQHCLVNSMHINLMYDDGTPMDERLPHGVTGWLADVFFERGKAQVSNGSRKYGFDAYGGKHLTVDGLMYYWANDKQRTDPRGIGFEIGEDIEDVEEGFFEKLPTLRTLWIDYDDCRISLTEKEDEIFKKNDVLIRGRYDSSAERLANKYGLRFMHSDIELACVGDYFKSGNDLITLRFREDGSSYIHQDCRCQGSSAGSVGGGEVSFDLPDDFYLTMQAEDVAALCWGSCREEIVGNGRLQAWIDRKRKEHQSDKQ